MTYLCKYYEELINNAKRTKKSGDLLFERGNLTESLINYMESSTYLENAYKLIKKGVLNNIDCPEIDKKIEDKISKQYLSIGDRLKEILSKVQSISDIIVSQKVSRGLDEFEDKISCINVNQLTFEKGSKHCKFFDDLVGLHEAKQNLISFFVNPLLYPNLYLETAKGILLYGLPGTGKTMLMKAAVNELQRYDPNLNVLFFTPTGAELKGKFVGETEKRIKSYFTCASRAANCCKGESDDIKVISVIFIDEIENIAGDRSGDPSGILSNSVNTLLQMMDGIKRMENIVVVGATNFPWKLDSAIDRRFTSKIYFSIPTKVDLSMYIRELINDYIKKEIKQEKIEDSSVYFEVDACDAYSIREKLKKGQMEKMWQCRSECEYSKKDKERFLLQSFDYSKYNVNNFTLRVIQEFINEYYNRSDVKPFTLSDIKRLFNRVVMLMADKASNRMVFYAQNIKDNLEYVSALCFDLSKGDPDTIDMSDFGEKFIGYPQKYFINSERTSEINTYPYVSIQVRKIDGKYLNFKAIRIELIPELGNITTELYGPMHKLYVVFYRSDKESSTETLNKLPWKDSNNKSLTILFEYEITVNDEKLGKNGRIDKVYGLFTIDKTEIGRFRRGARWLASWIWNQPKLPETYGDYIKELKGKTEYEFEIKSSIEFLVRKSRIFIYGLNRGDDTYIYSVWSGPFYIGGKEPIGEYPAITDHSDYLRNIFPFIIDHYNYLRNINKDNKFQYNIPKRNDIYSRELVSEFDIKSDTIKSCEYMNLGEDRHNKPIFVFLGKYKPFIDKYIPYTYICKYAPDIIDFGEYKADVSVIKGNKETEKILDNISIELSDKINSYLFGIEYKIDYNQQKYINNHLRMYAFDVMDFREVIDEKSIDRVTSSVRKEEQREVEEYAKESKIPKK